ncbi:probable gluconokinase isoform X1 [Lytechinus variegatus]|uniref:probable gluconokinase isoform X1 n=2 Tax=Lytechinus variegatus TaxID=7654 RepID=UPI001BB108AD|nr:probable gluconokinase isoform X1 [Lytechinus variegatus]
MKIIMILIVMGVSGSGKSTVGKMLGGKLQWAFEDGDDYHPPSNKTKMSSGIPLDDMDRYQWLLNLNSVIQKWQKSNQHGIIVCSALKRKYRQVLLFGAKAKYSDTNTEVSLSSALNNKHTQDIRTDSKSDIKFEQLLTSTEDRHPYQSRSTPTSFVEDVPSTSPSQREEHLVHNKDSCSPTGQEKHQVLFIHLNGTMELISSRLGQRKGHFFNPGLLHSQFDTLEDLGADEDGLVVDISKSLDSVVSQIETHVLSLLSLPIS